MGAKPFQAGRKVSHQSRSRFVSVLIVTMVRPSDRVGCVEQAAEETPPCRYAFGGVHQFSDQAEQVTLLDFSGPPD